MKMEALPSFETSVLTRAAYCNIPEDGILHSHHRENRKSYMLIFTLNVPSQKTISDIKWSYLDFCSGVTHVQRSSSNGCQIWPWNVPRPWTKQNNKRKGNSLAIGGRRVLLENSTPSVLNILQASAIVLSEFQRSKSAPVHWKCRWIHLLTPRNSRGISV
jgi:hypothetical protein